MLCEVMHETYIKCQYFLFLIIQRKKCNFVEFGIANMVNNDVTGV